MHPDDRCRRRGSSRSHLFKKGRHTVEYRFLKKDGSYCWVIDEQHLIRDRDGEPVEVVGSWSDVTAPKEAEIAFRRSEQRLTDAIESISEGFSLYDCGGRLIVCNSAYGELLYPGLGTPAPGTPYETLIRNAGEARSRRGCQGAHRGVDRGAPCPGTDNRANRISSAAPTAAGFRSTNARRRRAEPSPSTPTSPRSRAPKRSVREAKRQADLANEIVSEQKRELEVLSTKLSKYLSPQVYSSIFSRQEQRRARLEPQEADRSSSPTSRTSPRRPTISNPRN